MEPTPYDIKQCVLDEDVLIHISNPDRNLLYANHEIKIGKSQSGDLLELSLQLQKQKEAFVPDPLYIRIRISEEQRLDTCSILVNVFDLDGILKSSLNVKSE